MPGSAACAAFWRGDNMLFLNRLSCYALFLALLIAMGALPAGAASPEDALFRLKSPDPAVRKAAVLELGEKGAMAHTPPLAALLADDKASVREAANQSLWRIWMRSGDSGIDALMKKGVTLMNLGELELAIKVFGVMIREKPGFAEGWNKRATALFMAKRYRESIADCNKVLELNPYHFGALSGMGMNYVELDDPDAALDAFRRTLAILPHSRSTARFIEVLERRLAEKRKRI